MKTKILIVKIPTVILACLFFMTACDDLEKDALPLPESIELEAKEAVALAESPIVISLVDGVNTTAPLSIQITEKPKKGTLEGIGNGYFRYVPNKNTGNGLDFFTYTATSGNVLVAENQFNISIAKDTTDLPCSILTYSDTVTLPMDSTIFVDVLANDWVCDSLLTKVSSMIEIADAPLNGSATIEGDLVKYTSNAGYAGKDHFVYKICKDTICAFNAVNVTILGESDSSCLVLNNDRFSFVAATDSSGVTLDILNNDEICNTDTSSVKMTITYPPARGSVSVLSDNKIVHFVDSSATEDYSVSFGYEVCIDGVGCDSAQVVVDVLVESDDCDIEAFDDEFVWSADSTSMDSIYVSILDNDNLCMEGASLSLLDTNSAVTFVGDELLYLADSLPVIDTVRYQVCNPSGRCDEAYVVFR